jgi:hypothetical protein
MKITVNEKGKVMLGEQEYFGEKNQLCDAIADIHNIYAGRKESNPTVFSEWVKGIVQFENAKNNNKENI